MRLVPKKLHARVHVNSLVSSVYEKLFSCSSPTLLRMKPHHLPAARRGGGVYGSCGGGVYGRAAAERRPGGGLVRGHVGLGPCGGQSGGQAGRALLGRAVTEICLAFLMLVRVRPGAPLTPAVLVVESHAWSYRLQS